MLNLFPKRPPAQPRPKSENKPQVRPWQGAYCDIRELIGG